MALHIVEHPLLQDVLTRIRDRHTGACELRQLVDAAGAMVAYEACRGLLVRPVQVETAVATAEGARLDVGRFAVVPILRAGLALVNAMLRVLPEAEVWHLGTYRDEETLRPVSYYNILPDDLSGVHAVLCDVMIATGGTMIAATDLVKDRQPQQLCVVSLVASREGSDAFLEAHPDVDIYLAAVDPGLTQDRPLGLIVPGIGDISDRLFRTGAE